MTDELHVFDRPTKASGWAPTMTIRRTVRRRRYVRAGAGLLLAAAVAAGVLVGLRPDGPDVSPVRVRLADGVHVAARVPGGVELVADGTPIGPGASTSDIAAVAKAEQALTLRLLAAVSDTGNESVSAQSLLPVLAMLQTGARGATATQLAHALSGLPASRQDAALAALSAQLSAAASTDHVTLQSANALWQQAGFEVRAQFLAALSAFFHAGVWQADFAHHPDQAVAAIDHWAAANTHGKITKLFDSLDPSTVLVIANALYFHASWATPFDPRQTEPGPFTTSSGHHVDATFMNGGGASTVVTSRYSAAVLPYSGGRFTALAIMPESGGLDSFVDGLTPSTVDGIAGAASGHASVLLPRFSTNSDIDLRRPLVALGLGGLFGSPDLSGIAPADLYVAQAVQRVYVAVGETGTTAAAVTGAAITALSATAGPTVMFNRPFVFLVRDRVTGTILFATEVQDPTAG